MNVVTHLLAFVAGGWFGVLALLFIQGANYGDGDDQYFGGDDECRR